MSLPNVEVVTALFESYLNIRSSYWALNVSEPLKSDLAYKPASKMDVCIDCVQSIQKTHTANAWVILVHDFIIKAQAELIKTNESRGRFFGLGRLFVDRPLLLETLCAAISYINTQLKKDIATSSVRPKNEILDESELENFNNLLKSLNDLNAHNQTVDTYHQYYFDQIIKVRDLDATTLNETSFEDFEKNVIDKKRSLTICQKINEKDKTVKIPAEPVAAGPSEASTSTAKINAATILSSLRAPTQKVEPEVKISSEEVALEIKKRHVIKTKRLLNTRPQRKVIAEVLEENSRLSI